MEDRLNIDNLVKIFKLYPAIKLVYLFGSRAKSESGPVSDYDFAFYVDKENQKKIFDLKLKLMNKLSSELKTDKIDVVMLNTLDKPEMKYNIIKNGQLIYEKEPYRVLTEPKILNEYFDFYALLKKYNLTKA